MLTNIETERVRKGLTQEQLASQLGVSHKTYYNWINEKKDIPSQKLKKMSRMFKTNMEYLLGEEQKRVLYLCDGNVPTCKKNTCYKNPKRKGDCPPCTYTKDVAHGKKILSGKIKLSYAINKNTNLLLNALKPYEDTRKELMEEYRDLEQEEKAIEEEKMPNSQLPISSPSNSSRDTLCTSKSISSPRSS